MEFLLQERVVYSLFAAIWGVIFGSFATALVYRMPRDLNWVSKRSFCTKCERKLGVLDLIPVFSYIFLGGKCKCGTKISIKYLLIEIICGIGFATTFYFYQDNLTVATMLSLLFFSIVVLSAIDFDFLIIPDEVNLFIFILGFAYSIVIGKELVDILISSLAYAGFFYGLRFFMYLWKKKEALGLGDIKLLFGIGAFLNVETLPVFMLLSGVIGIVTALLWKVLKKGEMFPFGPALAISLLFCVYNPEIHNQFVSFTNGLFIK